MKLPKIASIRSDAIPWSDPLETFKPYASEPFSFLLAGEGTSETARFAFQAVFPVAWVSWSDGKARLGSSLGIRQWCSDPWSILNAAVSIFGQEVFPASRIGVTGYFSYDFLSAIEKISLKTKVSYPLPDFLIVFHSTYFVFDQIGKKAWKCLVDYEGLSPCSVPPLVEDSLESLIGKLPESEHALFAECDRKTYCAKVERIRDLILEGEVYEVNVSMRFHGRCNHDPYDLFTRVYRNNPAPFSAFLNLGRTQVVCDSPEMFLRAEGTLVETRPIKGTVPRGKTEEEDEKNRRYLLESAKEESELFMIIDLLRNDIGKVAETGSVAVVEAKRIEAYKNVWHLVGTINGTLENGKTYADLIRATFPGGSITGCPKIRSMEVIDQIETYRRGLYTGSIFMMNASFFVSNIVIRTSIIRDGIMFLNSGGAVTIDSEPVSEYEEVLHKVDNIARGFGFDGLV